MKPQHVITPKHLDTAFSYLEYLTFSEKLFDEHKTTSEDPHYNEDWILDLTRLNFQRIHRLEKTTEILPQLAEILRLAEPQLWVILAESWCGDVAQNVPVIQKMAELTEGKISLKLLLRDKNPDIMDAYLTNGGRSIPKLIALQPDTLEEIFTWGPRPAPVQALMLENKAQHRSFEESHEIIHTWYAKDKTHTLQLEFLELLSTHTA